MKKIILHMLLFIDNIPCLPENALREDTDIVKHVRNANAKAIYALTISHLNIQ